MATPRRLTAHATLVALAIGGLVLAGGIALIVVLGRGTNSSVSTADRPVSEKIASVPSGMPTATPTPSTSAATSSAPKKPSTSPAVRVAQHQSVTYVVKRGDNLTVIAAWFHQHGYGALYEQNRAVIGSNPNLIFPGERITITSAGMMTVSK